MDVGYRARIPPLDTGVPGLVLANTTQIYPEDRGTNYAVRLGGEAARALLAAAARVPSAAAGSPRGPDRGGIMDVNPIELQKHLKGVDYPATRDDLVSAAESNGAPQEVLDALRNAGKDSFDGPSAVQKALA